MSLSHLRRIITVAIAVLSLLPAAAFSQQGTRELFERARMLDESNQNLSEAIKLYGQVVSQSNEQRALAARAQYRIGALYERLGRKAEAQRAFQVVVNHYADQEVAQRARTKLPVILGSLAIKGRISANKSATGLAVRRVWADLNNFGSGMPSPDDRYLAFEDQEKFGNLAVRDLVTGKIRYLTKVNSLGLPDSVDEIAWSPDSKQLAYSWDYTRTGSDLRLISLDGSGMRILYRGEETQYCDPRAWSPDGKFILAEFTKDDETHQIALVAVSDGSVRVLKTIDSSRAAHGFINNKIDFSPDGRYIVYDYQSPPNSSQRDIFVLSIEDGQELPLIQHPADDYVLGWAPDGKSILFASNRTGTTDAWIISVADGKAQNSGKLVKREIGSVGPMGFTRSGSYYYSLSNGMTDVYLTTLDPETGKILSPPTQVSSRFVGVNDQPAWSRDGQQLVFRSQPDQRIGAGSSVVSILSTDTGKLRELTPKFAVFNWPVLLADGETVVVQGPTKDRLASYYKINQQTGEATPYELTPAATGITRKFTFGVFGTSIKSRNRETGEERIIYQAPQNTFGFFFAVSAGGEKLAFTAENNRGESMLSWMHDDGRSLRTILTLKAPERFQRPPNFGWLAWTPDGRYILFVKKPNPRAPAELWRIAADGGQPEYLGLAMEDIHQLRPSPDGRQLAFTAGSKRKPEIWVMENFLPKQNPKAQSRAVAGKH
jgi:Tol biopolymer transport system component